MPLELQYQIYELAFSPETKHVDILKLYAQWPNAALLSTCREVHDGAKQIYDTAKRDFWSTNHFVFHQHHTGDVDLEVIENLRPSEIADIKHFTVVDADTDVVTSIYSNGWCEETSDWEHFKDHEIGTYLVVHKDSFDTIRDKLNELRVGFGYEEAQD